MIGGSSFYVSDIDRSFVDRIYNWLNYLGIAELFPDLNRVNVREVGHTLRNIGEYQIYGMADRRTGRGVIRPGDFVSLLQILYNDKDIGGTVLDTEPGALAAQVFSTGDYNRAVNSFLMSKHVSDEEKQVARVMTEVTLVGGKDIFNWLKEMGGEIYEEEVSLTKRGDTIIIGKPHRKLIKGSYATLIHHLSRRIEEFERRYTSSRKFPEEYLIEVHKVPEEVAKKIVKTTNHSIDTIVRATDDTKKNMIGAFKGLASFLHINLNYPLDEAIARTIEMFKNDEAITINQTLYHGSKEVFARFEEYGVPREFTVALVDKLISDGSDYARLYAETFPKLLDFSQKFGPNGWNFLGRALRDPGFRYMLLNQKGVEGLNKIYDNDPSIIPALLENLLEVNWDFKKDFGGLPTIGIYDSTEPFQKLPFKLDNETKAKILSTAIVLYSMSDDLRREQIKNGIPFDMYGVVVGNIEKFLEKVCEKIADKSTLEQQIQVYFDRVKDARKLLKEGKPNQLKEPQEDIN